MVDTLFYVMAIGTIAGALGVITSKNPTHSVLSLLGTFFCLAVVYLLAGFQFLAAIQILVYAGAIMVLFLFVVRFLNLGHPEQIAADKPLFQRGPTMAIAMAVSGGALLLGLLTARALPAVDLSPPATGAGETAFPSVADVIFGKYLLPFELAAVLLLAAAVGVLVLTRRESPDLAAPHHDEAGDGR
jgi:NADH-quinone oxidoreductase subunit J